MDFLYSVIISSQISRRYELYQCPFLLIRALSLLFRPRPHFYPYHFEPLFFFNFCRFLVLDYPNASLTLLVLIHSSHRHLFKVFNFFGTTPLFCHRIQKRFIVKSLLISSNSSSVSSTIFLSFT